MAEVLSPPNRSTGQSYNPGYTLKRSSASQVSLPVAAAPSRRHAPGFATEPNESISRSLPSSSTNLYNFNSSHYSSTASTPASSIPFVSNLDDDQEIAFPSYDEVQFFQTDESLDLPPSPQPEEDCAVDSADSQDAQSTTASTRSDSPLPTPTVVDDTAVKQEPSRHVDYLSHDWREEDIWSSWRHIVSQRRVYGQRSRLENASWRSWAKSKYQLKTVPPETLNWLKDIDVTWLYGPLQPAQSHPVTQSASNTPDQISTSNSFVEAPKKPILKKRSMSEVMLQKCLSNSSLLKQAAASVQAQQSTTGSTLPPRRPYVGRAMSDYVSSNIPSEPISRDQLDYFTSRTSSSDSATPSESHKRHIRFDDKVEQCIAVDIKDADFDDDESDEEERNPGSDSDSSDDGLVMMKRSRTKRKRPGIRANQRTSSTGKNTIEKLPATTLKDDTPEPPEQPPTPFTGLWNSSKLSPSPSQETLRPSHPSRNFLLVDDDEDEDEADGDRSWDSKTFGNRRDSIAVHRVRSGSDPTSDQPDFGLRRTNSGMFMPYEEDEDDMVAAGLFGKVSDTINTAKDIAHVIWNVGWRK